MYRPLIFRSHMPWLGDICGTLVKFFPSRVHDFRMWAIGVAAARVRKGSPYEDIFYHLVRLLHAFVRCGRLTALLQADEGSVSKEKPAFPEIVADGTLDSTMHQLSNLPFQAFSPSRRAPTRPRLRSL